MADTWRAEVKGLRELQAAAEQKVRDLRGVPMENAMREAVLVVTNSAKRKAPVDTGRLRASVTPSVTKSFFGDTVKGIVGSNVKYAPYMELGTKPHWPPIDAILQWVHRKRIAGTYSIKTKRRMGGKAKQAAEDRAVAFIVARAISRRGTQAREFLKKSVIENQLRITTILSRAVGVIINKR